MKNIYYYLFIIFIIYLYGHFFYLSSLHNIDIKSFSGKGGSIKKKLYKIIKYLIKSYYFIF